MNATLLLAAILLSGPVSTAGTQEETVVVTGSAADIDGDTIPDAEDNCPLLKFADQSDMDKDGIGNACDVDADGDGWKGSTDPCPTVYNRSTTSIPQIAKRVVVVTGRMFKKKTVPERNRQKLHWHELELDENNPCLVADTDGDTLPDGQDRCPFFPTAPEQNDDKDSDGLGDACDPNPGIPENKVKEPEDPPGPAPGLGR